MTIKKQKHKIQIEDLRRTRKIVTSIIEHLDDKIINPVIIGKELRNSKELMEQINLLIGNKANITSVLTKLTNLLIKIIPLEQKTLEQNEEEMEAEETKVCNEDMETVTRYFSKVGFIFEKNK